MVEESLNYEKLKFKSGLEIHQQIDTKKLFCGCQSFLRNDEPDLIVNRKLHAVAGESGEIDIAAQYISGSIAIPTHIVGKSGEVYTEKKFSTNKEFIYQFYKDNNCLIDLDEEPPKEINEEALKIALQIALLLNCKIFSIAQIMRKTVIDGSNTSGFQRTILIARDGAIETSFGKVRIDTICLEEDSARKISEDKNKAIYRLDRLGIPLIEIATAPDIKSPEQAKEVALHIGEILRSCKVKRGIGTIRQDVNLSIRGEKRVELKGVQDMKLFVKIIENEVLRQKKLSDSGNPTKAEVRNVLQDGSSEFIRPMPGAGRMYPETDLPLLKISREFINKIKKELPKLKAEIGNELKQTGLNEEMVKLLLKENKVEEFKNLLNIYKNPNLIAKIILLFPKEISAKTGKSLRSIEKKLEEFYGDVLIALDKKKIPESDIKQILIKIISGESFENAIKIEKKEAGEIEEIILKIIKEKPRLNANAYMGLVMKEFSGKIDGKTAMEIIKKFIEKK